MKIYTKFTRVDFRFQISDLYFMQNTTKNKTKQNTTVAKIEFPNK